MSAGADGDGAGARIGRPLHRFLDHAASTPQPDLAADTVATFDHRKRCCLFLTYYSYGDTRATTRSCTCC